MRNPQPSRRRVAIIGGGIAGLASAHVLAQFCMFDVTIIEKNPVCGGLARSSVQSSMNPLPSQYCWHVFGSQYKTLRKLLSQIPDPKEQKKTLVQHLVPVKHCLASCYDIGNFEELLRYLLNVFGAANLLLFIWKCTMFKPRDVRNITWLDFVCKGQQLSEKQVRLAADVWSPILGIDPLKGSASSVLEILQGNPWFSRPVPFEVFDGPMTSDLFLKWQSSLTSQGVNILTSCKAIALDWDQGDKARDIRGIWIQSQTQNVFRVETDCVICATPPSHTASLLPPSFLRSRLDVLGRSMSIRQVSIALFLKRRLLFQHPRTIMLIADAPWSIVVEPVPQFWTRENTEKYLPPGADYLEMGLGNPYKPGVLSGKPWVQCSLKEIQDELWFQLAKASECTDIANLKHNAPLGIVMWRDFQWIDGEWRTLDDKRSSNAGTWKLRPAHPQTNVPFRNLWLAGDYMRGEAEVISMESAALSGVRTAADMIQQITDHTSFS
jgi:hypothetical protein